MKLKKVLVLSCILCMMLSFTVGCKVQQGKVIDESNKTETQEQTDTGTVKQSTGEQEKQDKPNFDKKLKFSINLRRVKEVSESELYSYFTQKFNVEFNILPHMQNDWEEKVRMWIASGDMPDLLYWNLKDTNYNEYASYVKQGVFKPLPDLDGKYPNLKKQLDTMKSIEYLKFDGKLYCLPATRDRQDRNNIASQGFLYRKDWAVKLGMAKDEYTWEEFIALAKAFMEKDPGGNGPGKTLGITGVAWSFPSMAGIQQINPKIGDYVFDEKKGEYIWGPTLPETLEGIKEAKRLYDQGILWNDLIICKSNEGIDKFIAGESGICYSNWDSKNLETQIYAYFKNIKVAVQGMDVGEAITFMPVKSPDNTVWALQNSDWWTAIMVNPKLDDERMERFLYMFDWLASEEGFHFRTKGIPGKHWDYIDGKVVLLWPKDEKGELVRPYNIYATELYERVGATASYDLEDPTIPEWVKSIQKAMISRYMKEDVRVKEFDYKTRLFTAPNYDKYGRFEVELNDKIKELIVSSTMDELEEKWNSWLKSMEPKVKLVLDELNGTLKK